MNNTPGSTARGTLEAKIWGLSGWQVDQMTVDELMSHIDNYTLDAIAAATKGETEWFKPVALKVTDLPADELGRLEEQREAVRIAAMAAGRSDGYQQGWNEGVAQGRSERPAERRTAFFDSMTLTPGRAVQAPDGMLWLFLGAPEKVSLPDLTFATLPPRPVTRTVTVSGTSQLQADQRKCRTCREVKALEKFYRDAKGSQGRKTQCGDCDAAAKRERNARKAQKVSA